MLGDNRGRCRTGFVDWVALLNGSCDRVVASVSRDLREQLTRLMKGDRIIAETRLYR